jgi:quinoprotein glucose dehydrogenase
MFCDWKMPGLNGRQIYERLWAADPDRCWRIVFFSGDVVNEPMRRFLESEQHPCLAKPFALEEIHAAIKTVPAALAPQRTLYFYSAISIFQCMKKSALLLVPIFCLLATAVSAQPLPKIQLQPVFPKLQFERPMWISEAPDGSGRFFVVYQPGKILIVKKGSDGGDAKEFFNIEDRHPYFENEDGLMSIAFHPGFTTNGLFYVYYNQKNPADQHSQPQNYPFRSVISEFKISATDPDQADMGSERIVLEVPQPFWNHKGGELAFGPDGYLYLGLGDGGAGGDPFGSGQSTTTLLAKMLRIDVNSRSKSGNGDHAYELAYGIPNDNPFAHESNGVRREIFAYGLRNPWRYSFDRQTGDLWAGDVGQDLWEEVDLVTKGGNYGWSVREGAHSYKPGPPGAQYVEPVMEYSHRQNLQSEGLFPDHPTGNCVIGGYVYRGKKYPALEGVYIYCDYSPGNIYGLRYDRDAQKVTAHGTLLKQPKSITSFAEDADGEIYALTQDGQIYMITVP